MNNEAFSLIELIIVMAVISTLATLAFVAIDPGKRIGQANDDERLVEARSIQIAIEKYTTDNFNLPPSILELNNEQPYMITYSSDTSNFVSCSEVLGNIQVVNLNNELEAYLSVLPIDPIQRDPVANGTGYYLRKNKDLLIEITPCDLYANNNDFIGNEIKSETVYDDVATHVSAVTLLNGNMFIVYRGVDFKGYFVIYDSEGRLVKSETVFYDTPFITEIKPTTLLNGNMLIAYKGEDHHGYFEIYDSEGTLIRPAEEFHGYGANKISANTLLDGNVFIAYRADSKGYFMIYDSEGTLIKSAEEFHDSSFWGLKTITLPNGNVFLSWRNVDSKGYFAIYNYEDNSFFVDIFHEEADMMDLSSHSAAFSNGNILIVYDEGSDNKFVIYDSEGTLIRSAEVFYNEPVSVSALYTNTLLSGNVMIVYRNSSTDKSYFVIYDSDGTLIRPAEVLNNNEASSGARATTFLNGNVMIIYEDEYDIGSKFVIYE